MKRPSPSMAVAVIAVIIALGASATATVSINSVGHREIKPNAVRASEIKDSQVRHQEIRGGAVRSSEVANNSLRSIDIGRNAVGSSEIQQASVQRSDLANGVRLLLEAPGPAGPRGLTGPTGPAGGQGPTGPAGSAAGYAKINSVTATVNDAQASNIADANLRRFGAQGQFCFGNLPFTPRSAVVSAVVATHNASVDVGSNAANATCQGLGLTGILTLVQIKEVSASNTLADIDFNVWFED